MASSTRMKIVFGLLTFVTVGMIIGALLQLAFIRRLEDSYGSAKSFRSTLEGRTGSSSLTRGYSHWAYDKEAVTLRIGYVKPEIISWSPRIILFHNFLSPEECDYLRAIALPRLQISTVVDAKTGKGIKSSVRTSSGMFLSHEERKYPMIQAIEKRISVYSYIPVENGELIQVLRLTFAAQAGTGECSCGGKKVKGLCVKPTKGDAILFWSMGLDGQSDQNSVHGGCEVLGGEKWSATKWMRQKETN